MVGTAKSDRDSFALFTRQKSDKSGESRRPIGGRGLAAAERREHDELLRKQQAAKVAEHEPEQET